MKYFFSGSEYMQVFDRLFIYALLLEIQLAREGWDLINQFNTDIFLCMSKASVWISNMN
jgi:hypothetical protein